MVPYRRPTVLLTKDHVDDPLSVFDMRHEASIPRTFLFSLNPIKHIIQKIANKYADVIQKVCVEVVVVSVLNYRIQIISETMISWLVNKTGQNLVGVAKRARAF